MNPFENVNKSSYQTFEWILNHSDSDFFSVIASEPMQSHVVQPYKHCNVTVYDYLLHSEEEYKFSTLEAWISDQPDKDAYFLLNFQWALTEEAALKRLNFSLDMLARLHKILYFA